MQAAVPSEESQRHANRAPVHGGAEQGAAGVREGTQQGLLRNLVRPPDLIDDRPGEQYLVVVQLADVGAGDGCGSARTSPRLVEISSGLDAGTCGTHDPEDRRSVRTRRRPRQAKTYSLYTSSQAFLPSSSNFFSSSTCASCSHATSDAWIEPARALLRSARTNSYTPKNSFSRCCRTMTMTPVASGMPA